MWRGILRTACDCGPGIFKAEPSRMEEVGEGHPAFSASRLGEA